MNFTSALSLFALCALSAACTTPLSPYNVSGKSATDSKAAALLIAESANDFLASRYPRASSPPRLVSAVAPKMSKLAINIGSQGTVRVEVSVAKNGQVTGVRVLESPSEYLSDDVSNAVTQWVFSPLVIDGEAREFKFRQPFTFRIGP